MKTQTQVEYLKECLEFHERRYSECCGQWKDSGYWKSEYYIKMKYHRRQAKWFKNKLKGPFREPVMMAPRIPSGKLSPVIGEANPVSVSNETWGKIDPSSKASEDPNFSLQPQTPAKPKGLFTRMIDLFRG